ncbi:kinase-like domain-containing protein [Schizophyllum amplum]|uniref:non-specific serine/threonine protein kinase n=1 Tax=Schizophyllum amplum TaxID=97359 RepID=A0A550C459_9AGAR|nr:kinase-like domain-containing protein [Auriculariopsis ampla]
MHDIRLPTPHRMHPLPVFRRRDLRVLRKLGSGSSGKVYLVRDANSNDARALKVVRKHNILQTLRAARWSMPLLAFWEDATSYHLLMPFYERDLEAELRCHGGKLSLESAVLFMAQILIALDEITRTVLVHRDVKPANIFLDAQGRLVLGDFGLARAFGTPPAPAQRATLPEWVTENEPTYLGMAVSFSVDLWAAAVTLFVMLCGRVSSLAITPR